VGFVNEAKSESSQPLYPSLFEPYRRGDRGHRGTSLLRCEISVRSHKCKHLFYIELLDDLIDMYDRDEGELLAILGEGGRTMNQNNCDNVPLALGQTIFTVNFYNAELQT
jgi:hypothetical protein